MSSYRLYALPWDRGEEQERAFRTLFFLVILAVAAMAVLVSVLPLPERDPTVAPVVPPRLARLVLERAEPPPPPPPPVRERPPQEASPQPAPQQPAPPMERTAPPPPVVTPTPAPQPPPVDRQREAREEAAQAGLMPLADELAALRDNVALGAVTTAEARIGSVGEAQRSERAILTRDAAAASGGVNTAALSRDTGGSGLSDRETTRVASTLAGMRPENAVESEGAFGVPARSREEIELVFDRNKGAIYALYNRALRTNPALHGKLVLQLTIEPSGEVSAAEIVSSELEDDELERRLIQRVRLFRFDDKDVAPVTTTKPIDFFPA
ncbi:MAG: AgmX/PglI C-terminal domain-containing protein [Gammaproteobacteria bacterium]|nr:AgmX/PglI C-terminal domain-containing protein [Gammaproteobacteria bacterium]